MTPAASEAGSGGLEGTPWVLVAGVTVEGWQAVAPSLTFADGIRVVTLGRPEREAAQTIPSSCQIPTTTVTSRPSPSRSSTIPTRRIRPAV